MYEKTYGKKYDSKLTRKEIAVRIREDLKAAVAAGELPKGCKFSVRSDRNSIDLRVTAVPSGFLILNPEYGDTGPKYGGQKRLTDAADAMLEKLREIHGAYNYDGSDIMTDYFNVNYYGHPDFAWELESAEREARKATPAPAAFIDWTAA